MKAIDVVSGCACCQVNRRRFLAAGCAACAGAAGIAMAPRPLHARGDSGKVRIRIIYSLHAPVQDRPDWPNIGFDFNPVMQRIEVQLKNHLPDFEFLTSIATGQEQAAAILKADESANIDGYLRRSTRPGTQPIRTRAGRSRTVGKRVRSR